MKRSARKVHLMILTLLQMTLMIKIKRKNLEIKIENPKKNLKSVIMRKIEIVIERRKIAKTKIVKEVKRKKLKKINIEKEVEIKVEIKIEEVETEAKKEIEKKRIIDYWSNIFY